MSGIAKAAFVAAQRADTRVVDARAFGAKGDGATDDTAALQAWLDAAEGRAAYLPPGEFIISGTLTVREGTTLHGEGEASLIQLSDSYALTSVPSGRPNRDFKPYLHVNSDNVAIHGIYVRGNTNFEAARHVGILVENCGHVLVHDVTVTDINFNPANPSESGATGYDGIHVLSANNVTIRGGRYERGGYQNIGVEASDNVLVDGIYAGDGWRTSVQVHVGSRNTRIINSTIRQSYAGSDSALTVHPDSELGREAHDLLIANNDIEYSAPDDPPLVQRGGIQFVWVMRGIRISGNRIHSTRWGIFAQGDDLTIEGNHIEGAKRGLELLRVGSATVSGNKITATGPSAPAVIAANSSDITLAHNHITAFGTGIDLRSTLETVKISGNVIHAGPGGVITGLSAQNIVGIDIDNNTIEATSDHCVHLSLAEGAPERFVRVRGNDLNPPTTHRGVSLFGGIHGPIVTGNTVRRGSVGVRAAGAVDYAIVSGNDLRGATTGVEALTGSNNIVSDNLLPT